MSGRRLTAAAAGTRAGWRYRASSVRGRVACLLLLGAVALAGCGSSEGGESHGSGGAAEAESIEHNEEAAEKKKEAEEVAQERELLIGIESKKQEETAQGNARRVEDAANAKAKKKLEAATRQARHKEKVAEEKAKKLEEEAEKVRAGKKPSSTTKRAQPPSRPTVSTEVSSEAR